MIGFNLLPLGNDIGGVDRYSFSLISTLASLFPEEPFLVIMSRQSRLKFPQANIKTIFVSLPHHTPVLKRLFEMISLNGILRRNRFSGVFHSVNNVIPPLFGIKQVVTIHDLLWKIDPHRFPLLKTAYLGLMVPFSIRRANAVIAVSACTKRDIIRVTRIAPEKVRVIPEALPLEIGSFVSASHPSSPAPPPPGERNRSGTTPGFFLFVGRLEYGKNVLGLIQAFEDAVGAGLTNTTLKIIGQPGWRSGYDKALAAYRHRPGVEFLGSLEDEALAWHYRNACAFVYPSRYEGFGLPVLEAMAFGVPVITSNTSSLPEITGDAALLVDPGDRQALATAMLEIRRNHNLRETLIKKGCSQAQTFSWEKTARGTWQVYRDVLGKTA
jgi:glycosyltransferase involved in cell wall biosynthesis